MAIIQYIKGRVGSIYLVHFAYRIELGKKLKIKYKKKEIIIVGDMNINIKNIKDEEVKRYLNEIKI